MASETTIGHERSPLLISKASSTMDYDDNSSNSSKDIHSSPSEQHSSTVGGAASAAGGSASFSETVINLMKTCMGTGCLALPYAAQQGGLLLFIFGTFGIALWSMYAVARLCRCGNITHVSSFHHKDNNDHHPHGSPPILCHKDSTVEDSTAEDPSIQLPESHLSQSFVADALTRAVTTTAMAPPPGTSSLGKVAWYALGPLGLMTIDFLMVTLLLGVVVAYQDAVQSFLYDTPFTSGWKAIDAMVIASIIAPLCLVPDLGYLSKASALGLSVLGLAMAVITGYGISDHMRPAATASLSPPLRWLPQDGISGVSHWFGCLVFGFGAVPLTFNFQESMAEPKMMVRANNVAMLSVSSIYVVIGVILSFLYPNIPGDVLHELPVSGVIPTITRLAFVVVVLATTPLLIVPCAELLEGKILGDSGTGARDHRENRYSRSAPDCRGSPNLVKTVVRFGIAFLTAAVSVGIPGFVDALSFVGCFCVTLVSFCIPPLLHVVLLRYKGRHGKCLMYWVDATMLAWGLSATCITSITTLHKMAESGQQPTR